ncbi:MAG: oligosaccharide flippase family protein [Clostridia bacterium]|nr:oligosaccharide flippase family protein [Clostridia bacterium]
MEKTRTQKSMRNVVFGLGGQAVELILKVVGRTIFIKFLAVEYLGVNGLFGEILTVLSLAELGIGSALGFALYKPLRENDKGKITALMDLYRKSYTIIGIVVAVAGAILIPFLKFIVKDPGPVKDDLIYIYLFYLFNTSITYFYSYKSQLLVSDQKNYIVQTVKEICNISRTVFQVVALVLWHKTALGFYLYLAVESFFIFLNNFIVSKYVDKKYLYLKSEKGKDKLDKKSITKIAKDVKALFITKVSTILVNSTDNTIISAICSIAITGLYSNYVMFTTLISTILSQMFGNLYPSVGNLNAEGDKKHSYEVFSGINLMAFWFFSFGSIGVFVLINDVIKIWIGEKYLLSNIIVVIIAVNLFVKGMHNTIWIFKDSYGLFVYGQYMTFFTAILNIVLSILFGKIFMTCFDGVWGATANEWGVFGILLATATSRFLTNMWYDPLILFKRGFAMSVWLFFRDYISYFLLAIIVALVTYKISGLVEVNNILDLLIKFAITCLVPNIIYFIIFFKTKPFIYVKKQFSSLISRRNR